MVTHRTQKPTALIVLDGWGVNPSRRGNAIKQADTPFLDNLMRSYPVTSLEAAGIAVGLPYGEEGNSEVGHLNLGSGLIVYQNLPRIQLSIQNKSFFKNEAFLQAYRHVHKNDRALHVAGLASPGGVHAHIEHLYALLELAKKERVKNVYLHLFTDGRDAPPQSFLDYFKELQGVMKKTRHGEVASLCGRFWAMDRNNNWDRTQKAYAAMIGQGALTAEKVEDEIQRQYHEEKATDEELKPVTMVGGDGQPIGPIKDGDAIVFFNFRPDRARQITKAFALPDFSKFKREKYIELDMVTMTKFDTDLPVAIAFAPLVIERPLAKVISDAHLKQLHIAETEKYAHVTYFFNGGQEKPFAFEEHALVPSPTTPDFSKVPAMSARGVTDRVVNEMLKGRFQFILINFANPDMIGHTGSFRATVKAMEIVDAQIKRIVETMLAVGGNVLITADHGNAEEMINLTSGQTSKAHSTNPVPLILIGADYALKNKRDDQEVQILLQNPTGVLADVAPTILDIMKLKQPKEMTGLSLLGKF